MNKLILPLLTLAALGAASTATAAEVVIDYEDLEEGLKGVPFSHQGVTYHDLNNVSGVFPNGETFGPGENDECIVENAGLFYGDFPGYGSPVHALTFGITYIGGENLTLGPLSTVTLDLETPATAASLDIGYYEWGPWGGIVYHLDALSGGQVVASDSFVIASGDDRDRPAFSTLSVANGDGFEQLHLYATYGTEYSMPRALVDDLTLEYADPSPTVETSWGRIKDGYR